jgi:hypothetical protein
VELVPCHVVVAASGLVGERVVGVVDLLEFLGPGLSLGTVGGDAVGVVAEGLSVRRGMMLVLKGRCDGDGWRGIVGTDFL